MTAQVRSHEALGNQVGIACDALNGFRWMLFQDRTVSNNVTIDKVVIVFGV